MKEIPLTRGMVALVDDEDYLVLSKTRWFALRGKYTWYAVCNHKENYLMHRYIVGAPIGVHVDHADGNGLNNQRENLRLCDNSRNMQNCRLPVTNTSGFRGVSFDKKNNKWFAYIKNHGRMYYLGRFDDKVEAAKVRDRNAVKLHGEFARLNFPESK